jgi:hypothetical protein
MMTMMKVCLLAHRSQNPISGVISNCRKKSSCMNVRGGVLLRAGGVGWGVGCDIVYVGWNWKREQSLEFARDVVRDCNKSTMLEAKNER